MTTVLAIVVALIVLNALYVAAEFAGVSARHTRLRQAAEDGSRGARWVLRTVEDPAGLDCYIAGCQVGITLSSLVLGAYAQATLIVDLASTCFPFESAAAPPAGQNWPADCDAFDRNFDPAGVGRQFMAVGRSGSRAEQLPGVTTPTLVIHGDRDTLLMPPGGRRTAELIPGARFELIEGMGHDYPPQMWRHWVDLVVGHIREHS